MMSIERERLLNQRRELISKARALRRAAQEIEARLKAEKEPAHVVQSAK